MKLLLTLSILFAAGPTLAEVNRCDKKLLSSAAAGRDLDNVTAVLEFLSANGYDALTEEVLVKKSVELVPMHTNSSAPAATPEILFRRRFRLRFENIDPSSQRSIWEVARALAEIEVAARVRLKVPLVAGRRGPWLDRPHHNGVYRGEQVAPVITDMYRLLVQLDQIIGIAGDVLPKDDPALKFKTLRAVAFGPPRTGPNKHDLDRHYLAEGRGADAVSAVLFERYEREMLIAAWREQLLSVGWKLAILGAVGTPLVYYGVQHLPQAPTPPPTVTMQTSDVVEAPRDAREKAQVIKKLQGLVDEVQRRKSESIRFPDTGYINEAKQAVTDFYSAHPWLYADPSAPR